MPPTFADLGVPAHLVARLTNRGITEAFPIQEVAIPDALAGRDVVGQASTGSGKTLAFGLPLLARLRPASPHRPRALVLTPTRELAAQIQRELAALVADGRRIISIFGGTPYSRTRRSLASGVDVVVACPGRLEDLLAQGALSLSEVDTVVVDEADRMADMGFLPAVTRILALTPAERTTLLFSATMGPEVTKLVQRFTRDAAVHDVVAESAPDQVEHVFWRTAREARVDAIVDILNEHGRAIVFTRTKHGADRLAKQLGSRGVDAAALHGDRSQAQRDRALAMMAQGKVRALVATDVAARGIHIEDLPVVVHFDPPTTPEDYIHRSGRTGRAGASGTVITLVADDVVAAVGRLQRALGLSGPVAPRTEAPTPRRPPIAPTAPEVPAASVASATPTPPHRTAPDRPRRRSNDAPARDRAGRRAGEAVVTFFNGARGFGFASDDAGDDLFLHVSRLSQTGGRTLAAGERITFDEVRGPRGREAHNIRTAAGARHRASRRPASHRGATTR